MGTQLRKLCSPPNYRVPSPAGSTPVLEKSLSPSLSITLEEVLETVFAYL